MKRLLPLALLTLPLLVAGCSSAQRQYERGMELEVQGDFAGAARYYADAIRRDRDLNRMLPGRLRESGRQAIEAYVADARSLETAGRPIDAADRYRDADAIIDLGISVRVDIPTPSAYAEDRRAVFDAAVSSLLEEGTRAHAGKDYQLALRRLERAERYEPSREQVEALRDEASATRLSWANQLLESGQYRQAYEVAQAGLATPSRLASDFREVQMHALDWGTVRLAAFPLQALPGEVRDLPRQFIPDLSLLLDDEYWIHPPLFIATADPRDVRSLIRRRLQREVLVGNQRLAASLGRDLGADFALAAGIDRFVRTTGEERRTERTASLSRRGGGTTTYTEVRTPTTFRGSVRFEVIDVGTRRVVCSARVERTASGPVLTGEYAGDPRELRLSRDQEELFTRSGRDVQERRLHDRLGDELARALADRVYGCVVSHIP